MDRMGCEGPNYKDFVAKKYSLTRYSSFDGLVELYIHHFELCMRAEKSARTNDATSLSNSLRLQYTYIDIMSPVEASE